MPAAASPAPRPSPEDRSGWWRQPWLHFLILGIAFFALYEAVGPRSEELSSYVVEVSAEQVAALRAAEAERTGAPPDDARLAMLLDQTVEEELLIREALELGLDRGDPIIRRRLLQKMRFLADGLARPPAPSEAELEAYLERHRERYRQPAAVAFEHRYLSRDRHGEELAAAGRELLAVLTSGSPASEATLGDPFMVPSPVPASSRAEVAARFGGELAASLLELPEGSWQGPFASTWGLHLVRVLERRPAREATLTEVRSRVEQDLTAERLGNGVEAYLNELKDKYEVRFPAGAP